MNWTFSKGVLHTDRLQRKRTCSSLQEWGRAQCTSDTWPRGCEYIPPVSFWLVWPNQWLQTWSRPQRGIWCPCRCSLCVPHISEKGCTLLLFQGRDWSSRHDSNSGHTVLCCRPRSYACFTLWRMPSLVCLEKCIHHNLALSFGKTRDCLQGSVWLCSSGRHAFDVNIHCL